MKSRSRSPSLPLWLKLVSSAWLVVLVPVYWMEHGPANFLWLSDIALLVTVLALWLENRFLVSMMAVGVLLPEIFWNLDFFTRLLAGHDVLGLDATAYMFSPQIPWLTRGLSLFHVFLPALLIFALLRLGYAPRAFAAQVLLVWLVLPVSYLISDPQRNINLVYGLSEVPQTWLPDWLYLLAMMLLYVLLVSGPTHLVLKHVLVTRRGSGATGRESSPPAPEGTDSRESDPADTR